MILLKEINDSLSQLAKEQIKCNTENRAAFRSINRHLSRLNGSVSKHTKSIRELEDFKTEHETIDSIKREYKEEVRKNRRLIWAAILGLISSIVVNIVF